MYRYALDGYEKSPGKDYKDTKNCAMNLAILLAGWLEDKEKTRALIKEYPHFLLDGGDSTRQLGSTFAPS